ncbi:suppressor of fused domain protein [Streptomyces niveiscabiei]|uniref:suppressor of fused domain protein n=1 Tax=Streptomyces TaxID=1883 RepID=UPI00131BD62F|nr:MULTISPECIES: suppressor of fused domain protein [Streptomyces]
MHEALRRHLENSWPDRHHEEFRWMLGPIEQVLPSFAVHRVSPLGSGDSYMYLSVGAFGVDGETMSEFFVMSPTESPRHVETLAMVAHYHSFPQHRLSHGSVLDIGRSWVEGSMNHHLFVSWPYSLDRRAATCMAGGKEITYLWLIPISAEEARFAREVGTEALEERLEDSGVNLLDPLRNSTV